MRKGISITVSAADRRRLEAITAGRSTPQKHVWRARIVLLSGDGVGTNAIMTATGKSKTTVWRWQEWALLADESALVPGWAAGSGDRKLDFGHGGSSTQPSSPSVDTASAPAIYWFRTNGRFLRVRRARLRCIASYPRA